MLLADELAARRWAGRVAVLTVSPGMVDTGLWRHFPLWYQAVTWPVRATALRSVDDGAVGVVWAAAAREAEGLSGVLLADGVTVDVSEAARDAVTRGAAAHWPADARPTWRGLLLVEQTARGVAVSPLDCAARPDVLRAPCNRLARGDDGG